MGVVRFATQEDNPAIYEMAKKFAAASPFSHLVSEPKVGIMVGILIDKNLIIYHEDGGFLAFSLDHFTYGFDIVATELAWWVNEDVRNTKVGKELLQKFEAVAKSHGAKAVTVSSLDEEVGKYYEKKGYTLSERAYIKELNGSD